MMPETTMTLTVPDGEGGEIITGPFTLDDLKRVNAEMGSPLRLKESDADREVKDRAYGIAAEELRGFIERWERLDDDRQALVEDQKEVMAEAKGRGYDTKVIKRIIALRKRDADDIAEEEAILEMYKAALGMG